MDKRNSLAATPGPRFTVDELNPLALEMGQGGDDVGNAEGYVMQALAPPLQKPPHGCVGGQGAKQLNL